MGEHCLHDSDNFVKLVNIIGGDNMSYKVAICDDNSTDSQYVKSMLSQWAKERSMIVDISVFSSAEQFLFDYADHKDYDILLLDIEMGQMDGVQMARTIRRENNTVQIIFITGYSDYIAEGYDVAALHYLMKPLNIQKFFDVLHI